MRARCLHPRDHVIDIRGLNEIAAVPPERQRMAVEPSRGVQVIQRPLVWFGQTEQTARAMQQQCKLAWLPFDDQQPIRDLRLLMSPVSGVRGGEAAPHPHHWAN